MNEHPNNRYSPTKSSDLLAPRGYRYEELFYKYIEHGSAKSAKSIVPHVISALEIRSILDVGCGRGAWMREYLNGGINDCIGVDGEYVDDASLLIPKDNFKRQDISESFDLRRTFDLVQCLEVAEHIPNSRSETLIENLSRHGDKILFSAAVPGQGGEHHINEQDYEYWRAIFAARGFRPFDFLRPGIRNRRDIEPWYRHNTILYVHDRAQFELPELILRSRVTDGERIRDYSSRSYRIRKAVLRPLPAGLLSSMAVVKHWSLTTLLKARGSLKLSSRGSEEKPE